MVEVKSQAGESLPKNIDRILSNPFAFLLYFKTQLAAFAKVLANYEEYTSFVDDVETRLIKDDFIRAVRSQMKPFLVTDSDATDKEIQKKFNLTGREVVALFDVLEYEFMREENSDIYIDLENFVAEFAEKMGAVLALLENRLNSGAYDYIGDKWVNDDRFKDLVYFLEQLRRLDDDCEDVDPENELYRPVMVYLFSLPLSVDILRLRDILKDVQDYIRFGFIKDDAFYAEEDDDELV